MVNGRCIEDLEKSIDSPISLLNLVIQRDLLRPSVIVEYDRSAYVYDWGNTRITFDRNVRSSTDFIGFVHGNTCNYHTVIYDSKQTVELRLLSGQHTIYLNVIDSEAEKIDI